MATKLVRRPGKKRGRADGILFALIFWYSYIKTKVRKGNKVNIDNFF